MNMDGIKLFAKKWKRIKNPNTGCENIQSEHRDGIQHRKMYHANNEKREMTNDYQIKKKSECLEKRNLIKHLGCPTPKILRTNLEVDNRRTSTRSENMKTNDDA